MKNILILLALLVPAFAWATTYESATNNRSAAVGATTISDSFSHTFSSNADRCAVVAVFLGDIVSQTVASVTVGGVAGTLVIADYSDSTGHGAEMWVALDPPSGLQTIEVTLSATGSYEWWQTVIELSDCAGARTGSGIGEGGTSAPNPQTLTVTSAVGDIVLDALSMNGTALGTAGGSQTGIRSTNTSDVQHASYASGAASVDMTWNGLGASDYAHVAASFESAGGGSSSSLPAIYRHLRQMKQ